MLAKLSAGLICGTRGQYNWILKTAVRKKHVSFDVAVECIQHGAIDTYCDFVEEGRTDYENFIKEAVNRIWSLIDHRSYTRRCGRDVPMSDFAADLYNVFLKYSVSPHVLQDNAHLSAIQSYTKHLIEVFGDYAEKQYASCSDKQQKYIFRRHKELLHLHYVDGLKIREIAERFEISTKLASYHHKHALAMLKEFTDSDEFNEWSDKMEFGLLESAA